MLYHVASCCVLYSEVFQLKLTMEAFVHAGNRFENWRNGTVPLRERFESSTMAVALRGLGIFNVLCSSAFLSNKIQNTKWYHRDGGCHVFAQSWIATRQEIIVMILR